RGRARRLAAARARAGRRRHAARDRARRGRHRRVVTPVSTPVLSSPGMFGRYELLAPLARGGMAEVFLARRTGAGGFSKLLVIKRMLPHLRDDPVFHQMFLDEGRIAARLDHPNVCHVYELGEVDGDAYLAMEYLTGVAWSEIAARVPRTGAFHLR